jgi:hypothetical protein
MRRALQHILGKDGTPRCVAGVFRQRQKQKIQSGLERSFKPKQMGMSLDTKSVLFV